MRKLVVLAFSLVLAVLAHAQAGGSGFGGAVTKLFGDNNTFTSDILMQMESTNAQLTSLPGKLAYNDGDSRLEIDLAAAKGPDSGQDFVQLMKAAGMEKTVTISRPEKKEAYIIYPSLSAYAVIPLPDSKPSSAFKTKTIELGKETLNGHSCVKNKVTVTDDEGKSHENTVWNATDLNSFPIKIETGDPGHTATITFSNVKLGKPNASLFEAPRSYKKYDSQQALKSEEMMKRSETNKPPGQP